MNLKTVDEIQKIQLEYTDKDGNEQSFTPDYRVPSMAAQDAILPIREKLLDAMQKIDEKAAELNVFIDDYGTVKAGTDPKMQKKLYKKLADIAVEQFKYDIEFFKVIINTKQLTTEQKTLVSKPSTDIFWKEQNIVAISAAVLSFRELVKV